MSDPNLWQPPLPSSSPPTPDVTQKIAQQISTNPNYQRLLPPVEPISSPQVMTQSPFLNKVLSGMSSFNKAFMQASPSARLAQIIPFVKQSIDQQNAASESLRQQYPGPAKVGTIGGIIGSGITPGGGGAATLPLMAASAATSMAPFSILKGIDTYKETGDIKKAVKDAAISEAEGTGGGVVLGGITEGLSRFLPALRRGVINQSLSGDIGVQGRQFAQNLKGIAGGKQPGSIIARANTLKEQIVELANATKGTPLDISTETGKINFVNDVDQRWDAQVDQSFNQFKQQGGSISDLRNSIYSNSRIQETIDAHPELIDKLDGIIDHTSKTADIQGIGAARKYLREQVINLGSRPGASDDSYLAGELGKGVHDVIDENFVPQELKATYGRDKLVKQVLSAEEMKIPKIVKSGPETAARLLAHAAMTAGGAFVPGIGIPMAAVGIGGIVNDIASGVINKGLGKLATRIVPHLGAMTGEGVANIAGNIPGIAAREIGASETSGPGIMDLVNGPTMPTGTTMGGGGIQPPQQIAPVPIPPPGAQPIPNASIPPAGPAGVPPGAQPIPLTAPQLSPQEQGQIQFNQAGKSVPQPIAFNDATINDRLQQKYIRHIRQYGQDISFEQFANEVRQGTNNFNPDNFATWQGMFDSPQEAERLFKAHMNLKKIENVDLGDALNHYTRPYLKRLGGVRFEAEQKRKEDEDNVQLIQALSGMGLGQPKEIDNRLKQIAWDRSKTPEERQHQVMQMIIKEGGVDVPSLIDLGLWGANEQ